MPLLMGLEASDWKFSTLSSSDYGPQALDGVREAIKIVSRHHTVSEPWWTKLLGKATLQAMLWIAPKVVPLPLEIYLDYHFTKVGDQTRLFMDTYIRMGQEQGLPTSSLETLRGQILAAAA